VREVSHDGRTITELLIAHREGDSEAFDRLVSLLYVQLSHLARVQLRGRRPGDSLDTVGLLHESYIKLVDTDLASVRDRSHFFAVAALSMRHIVIDHARRRARKKRGGQQRDLPLREDLVAIAEEAQRFLDLDDALERLARVDLRLVQVVECRFFAGLSEKETAAALSVTERTVQRDWRRAKGWLHDALGGRVPAPSSDPPVRRDHA
jgi:RNA polymerase sigma factor (TIGR02999 family)